MSPEASYCIPLTSQRQFALNSRQRITFWRRGRPMQVSIAPAGAAQALCIPVPRLGQGLAGLCGAFTGSMSSAQSAESSVGSPGGREGCLCLGAAGVGPPYPPLCWWLQPCSGDRIPTPPNVSSLQTDWGWWVQQSAFSGLVPQGEKLDACRRFICLGVSRAMGWDVGRKLIYPQRRLWFFAAAKDGTAGVPNLQLHDLKTGKCLKSFIQKKMQNW